ncbi:MAG TPA: prenyltransferase/squalene oxidase repeat-containing protein [Candidatus Paceibacterota bacterium]|nr:prenyltransferase/squalene oxidase repeat-containing protein [Candidatus Paceibacterota bacterium]
MGNFKTISALFLTAALFLSGAGNSRAEVPTADLTIRDGGTIVFSGPVPLEPSGIASLADSDGNSHDINADSVLYMLHDADQSSNAFDISDLVYYDSFGSFYLKCITDTKGEECDNWQYVVDGASPSESIDHKSLSGGESVYVYFGPEYRVSLSSDEIATNGTLTATAQSYEYESNSWSPRTGVTIGLTQPNPADPYSPDEIMTAPVDDKGQAQFSGIPAGSYDVGVKEDYYFPTESLTVSESAPKESSHKSSHSGGSSSGAVLGAEKHSFDPAAAANFLYGEQKDDGSFGGDLYTDWAAVALGPDQSHPDQKLKLQKYLLGSGLSGNPGLTDFERRALALESQGLNPYSAGGVNYIKKIEDSFDGTQFGDPDEDNDDAFALIVLLGAGVPAENAMMQSGLHFLIERQKFDGSWDSSADMTGAALEAIGAMGAMKENKFYISAARVYLKKIQNIDGGFGNVSSTAWIIEGILALPERVENWALDGNTPADYIGSYQESDGGISSDDENQRIWETAYSLSALSGKDWSQLIAERPAPSGPDTAESMGSAYQPETEPAASATHQTITEQKTEENSPETIQNLAEAAAAVPAPTQQPSPEPKKSWFGRLLSSIWHAIF